jgi:hypothetical protein
MLLRRQAPPPKVKEKSTAWATRGPAPVASHAGSAAKGYAAPSAQPPGPVVGYQGSRSRSLTRRVGGEGMRGPFRAAARACCRT